MVLSGVVASASLPEKSSSLSRHRDLESMLGVPASGLPLSSLDAARTRNDRRARDRRVRDTIAPPVRADATLAVPIGAVAILSVHVMNLAARLLGSSDGLDTIYSGGMHCGTTRTTSGEARAGPRALECGSLGDRFSDYFIQVSTLWLAGGERRWKTFRLRRMDVAAENELYRRMTHHYVIICLRRLSSPVAVEVAEHLIDPLNLPAELKLR